MDQTKQSAISTKMKKKKKIQYLFFAPNCMLSSVDNLGITFK